MPANNVHPTLGFATKRDAILHLYDQGYGVPTIVHDVGSTPHSVMAVLWKAGRKPLREATYLSGGRPQIVAVPAPIVAQLRPHAARRGLSCAALLGILIDTIADAGLVDAILDDRGTR